MSPTVVIVFFVFIHNVLPTAESAPLGFGLVSRALIKSETMCEYQILAGRYF